MYWASVQASLIKLTYRFIFGKAFYLDVLYERPPSLSLYFTYLDAQFEKLRRYFSDLRPLSVFNDKPFGSEELLISTTLAPRKQSIESETLHRFASFDFQISKSEKIFS